MSKKPVFFRDESDMGDVFDKAKKLLKDVKVLEGCTKSQRELIDKYHEQVENVRCGQVIKKLIGKKTEDFKSTVAGMTSEWNEKKIQLKEGIVAQQQTILGQRILLIGKAQCIVYPKRLSA